VVLFYEKLFDESGDFLAAGELLYARLDLEDRFAEAWRYERLDGTVEYYEVGGDSVRKSLLKTPVDGARISSGFGYRNIPILGFSGLHRGMDFAVAAGTPVMASGEGTVITAGWHDQYGYRVKIRHPNHYDTMYAHFSSIASGIKTGVRVKQGQTVGYVGSTGNSTGPHCHYEVLYYGSPVNPAELKFPPGHKLETEDMRLFDLEREALIAEFNL
jgi:murein DD-endopeptidase MepM/ murein hydrolase activator NlpD